MVSVNGTAVDYTLQDGYMTLDREWQQGDVVSFSLPMPVRHVLANEAVAADAGLVAVERGPIVYCMEQADNTQRFDALICNDEATASVADASILGYHFQGITLDAQVKRGSETAAAPITLIPYYAWNNRGRGTMKVWMPRTAAAAKFEAWPVGVSLSDVDVLKTQDLTIETEPLNDAWATHTVTGLTSDIDVPTTIGLPITSFSLNMMYAPVSDTSLHMVFSGNPGTGKTTIARIMAEIFKDLGVLQKGHLIEATRADLVAGYMGQTAIKTNKVIDEALDGVLFIDEAYTLARSAENDYGQEAIDTLLKRMEDDRERLIVIIAGYTEEIKRFVNSNPGLSSRFNRYINFPDYSEDELAQIFRSFLSKYDYKMGEAAAAAMKRCIADAVRDKDSRFGNGRFVRNLFEKVIEKQANRLAASPDLSKADVSYLTVPDFDQAFPRK